MQAVGIAFVCFSERTVAVVATNAASAWSGLDPSWRNLRWVPPRKASIMESMEKWKGIALRRIQEV